jgi:hypothetical protein
VFLYAYECWPLTLREEHRLRVFENRARLRQEVAGGWRILHNEDLHTLYSTPNNTRVIKFRRTRWAGHEARNGEMRNA